MASPKPNSNNKMQTTRSPSGLRRIKATLNFRMNYGASKATTALDMSYEKYLENTSHITHHQKVLLAFERKTCSRKI